jgi:glucose-6-phosphate 1-epimerase
MDPLSNSTYCKLITKDELECLHIQHPKCFAEICLQGAQLTQFQATNKEPLIWLSPTAEYKLGTGLRGGIPVCWPWFGALNKNPEAVQNSFSATDMAHGFARTQLWSLNSINESEESVVIKLELQANEITKHYWPHDFSLNLTLTLSESIELSLTTHNISERTFNFSQALHTYFPVNDIHQTSIIGVEGQAYIDALDNWDNKVQERSLKIQQEVDRLYFGKGHYEIRTPKQTLVIQANSNSSVIWNPWIEKSQRLSQFPDTAYQDMLCIESANVMADHVSLAPNSQHTLSVTINASTD